MPKISCPECGLEVSKNNYGKHWRFHRMIEATGHGAIRPYGAPLEPLRENAPVISPLATLTIDTSAAAPPSVSSVASSASETAQYTTAARALLKRTERYGSQPDVFPGR